MKKLVRVQLQVGIGSKKRLNLHPDDLDFFPIL